MKAFLLFITLFIVWTSGSTAAANEISTSDAGVVINGIRWATRNVDAPGTFARNPEDTGMFFQWNHRGSNPCPPGWRVPMQAELNSLRSSGRIWTTRNGVAGRLFGTAPNQIFLPAAGFRYYDTDSVNSEGSFGFYWSSTQNKDESAVGLSFGRDGANIFTFWQSNGFSVRCVAVE